MTVRSTELSGTWPFLSTKISQSATISQGSVATHLRGGEIYFITTFATNLLLRLSVKEF